MRCLAGLSGLAGKMQIVRGNAGGLSESYGLLETVDLNQKDIEIRNIQIRTHI